MVACVYWVLTFELFGMILLLPSIYWYRSQQILSLVLRASDFLIIADLAFCLYFGLAASDGCIMMAVEMDVFFVLHSRMPSMRCRMFFILLIVILRRRI